MVIFYNSPTSENLLYPRDHFEIYTDIFVQQSLSKCTLLLFESKHFRRKRTNFNLKNKNLK